ncbi:hypothetical protein RBC47_30500 [Pseudomonas fluorescens]|uniref:hypothetical protein n=1 Tax=Pseudomonas fluorescens TaxID=294 RepID=UPI003832E258
MTTSSETQEHRLAIANSFLNAIASHGRQFFLHKASGRIAELSLHNERVLILDEYTQKVVDTHSDGSWPGFCHGGGLRDFVRAIRDFVLSGDQIRHQYFKTVPPGEREFNYWGYDNASLDLVREAGQQLGIVTAGSA